jgi:hypothetical protein
VVALTQRSGFWLLTGALVLLAAAGLVRAADNSAAEIEYLLQAVGESGCVFQRNGEQHDSAEAESHLRLKYRNGKRYVDSAEMFIKRLATKSSWTGKAFIIDCSGQSMPSADWLMRELNTYRDTTAVPE